MPGFREDESEPVSLVRTLAREGMEQPTAAMAREVRTYRLTNIVPPLTVATMYFLAAELGAWLAFPSAPVSAFWAPNALLFAALVLAPRERWWTYLTAIVPFHLAAQLPTLPVSRVVIQYFVNIAIAVLGAWALARLSPQPRSFDRLRSAVVLIVFGAILAPLITSVVMAAAFYGLGLTNDFPLVVTVRTITNAFAVVTLVPLIVHGFERIHHGRKEIELARIGEAAVLALSLTCVGFLVFVYPAATSHLEPALLFGPLPFLIWAVMRFGTAGACGAALLLGALSTWGVLNGHGPFTMRDPVENALFVVTLQVATAMALLMLSSLLQERRFTTRSLSETEARFRNTEGLHTAVLASLHDQIAVLDRNGTVMEINDSWHRFVETAQPPRFDCLLAGQNFVSACLAAVQGGDPAAAEELEAVRAVLGGSEVHRQLELAETTASGSRWFEVSIEQLRQEAGGAIITRTDVTARKQAELEARNQRQQLTHLGRAAVLGELSGAFAHELNQPLTSILGNAEAALRLLSRNRANPAEMTEILHDIVHDDERAAQVIQRLRSLLRKGEMQRQPVNLNTTIQEVLQLARSELITRNVRVTTSLDAQVPLVMADRVHIQQVILNLLMNACDAMTGVRPPDRRVSLSTSVIPRGDSVEVAVRDSGCGIPAGEIERIFQPFVTSKSQGLGLGLAISRSVAEAHHGQLWAENAAQGGAIFRLRLPLEGGGTLQ